MIYLDNAASAGYSNVDDIIVDAITTAMRNSWQNPSSLYASKVKDEVNKCRDNVAKFINAESDEIYFTSGSSESNSWVIRSWVNQMMMTSLQIRNIITTPIEHKSIMKSVESKTLAAYVQYCEVDGYGLVDLRHLESLLKTCQYEPILVSICMANNEIGTIQNIKDISNLVHKYGGILHTDATQAFGHIPIDVEELGIDLMSCSGHKVSPVLKGIGFLYKKNGINIQPLIYGSQEQGLRGGTTNTFSIIGLSKALEYCDVSKENIDEMCAKRDYFINHLESKFNCKLNGHREQRLSNNINVTFQQNITGESLLYMLDMSGIQVSTGSACNSTSIESSHVLKAIGLNDDSAMKTIRISLSDDITYEDIDFSLCEISKCLSLIES